MIGDNNWHEMQTRIHGDIENERYEEPFDRFNYKGDFEIDLRNIYWEGFVEIKMGQIEHLATQTLLIFNGNEDDFPDHITKPFLINIIENTKLLREAILIEAYSKYLEDPEFYDE